MKRRLAILGAAAAVLGLALAALGQEATSIDPEAVTKRAEAYAADAADLVKTAQSRLKAEAPDVKPLVDHAKGALGTADVKGIDGIKDEDLASLVNAGRNDGKFGKSHVGLIAFVSLSMPPDTLRKVMIDMQKAGGVVVFRGFPGNSMAAFKTQLGAVMPAGLTFHNIGIDPRLFEAFHVESVPTYIAVDKALDLCKPLDCISTVPEFDALRGNVPVSYALETFANGNGPGAALARIGLAQLEAQ